MTNTRRIFLALFLAGAAALPVLVATINPANAAEDQRDAPNQSLMPTENVLDINFRVFWVIKDADAHLFKVENPAGVSDATIKAVAKSAIREVVGKNQIEPILTANREPIQVEVRDLMQRVLDDSGVAVIVTRVQMQNDPPAELIAGAAVADGTATAPKP
jgi:regulator of protease activity HflC (stomatin/prohibitin superfamily)